MIGAGSVVFSKNLTGDILSFPEFKDATLSYGMVPAVLFGYAELPARLQAVPPAATLLTSMFLHGGLLH